MNVTLTRWCERHQQRCTVIVREDGQNLHNGTEALQWADMRPNRVTWDAGCTDDFGGVARRFGTILRHVER